MTKYFVHPDKSLSIVFAEEPANPDNLPIVEIADAEFPAPFSECELTFTNKAQTKYSLTKKATPTLTAETFTKLAKAAYDSFLNTYAQSLKYDSFISAMSWAIGTNEYSDEVVKMSEIRVQSWNLYLAEIEKKVYTYDELDSFKKALAALI